MEAEFGLDQPLMVRYVRWLWEVVHLNFGVSLAYRVNVTEPDRVARGEHDTAFARQHDLFVGAGDSDRNHRRACGRTRSSIAGCRSFPSWACRCRHFSWPSWRWISRCGADGLPVGGSFSPDYAALDAWSKVADRINHLILPALVLGVAGHGLTDAPDAIANSRDQEFGVRPHGAGQGPAGADRDLQARAAQRAQSVRHDGRLRPRRSCSAARRWSNP